MNPDDYDGHPLRKDYPRLGRKERGDFPVINHGHFRVNKKKVNISSYLLKEEDLIEVKDKSKALIIIDTCLASKERDVPEYIQLDIKNKTAKLVRVPKFADIPYPTLMEPKLVIEYYSR